MSRKAEARILFVEDSEEDFLTAERAFLKLGMTNPIDRVRTGDEALEHLRRASARVREGADAMPSLIVLDLNLPGLDGRSVLREIKTDSRLKMIPVIILTTSVDEKDVRECYQCGANSYIQKPVEFDGFVEAMRRLKDYWLATSILPGDEPR